MAVRVVLTDRTKILGGLQQSVLDLFDRRVRVILTHQSYQPGNVRSSHRGAAHERVSAVSL